MKQEGAIPFNILRGYVHRHPLIFAFFLRGKAKSS